MFVDDDEVGRETIEGFDNTGGVTSRFLVVFCGGPHKAEVHVKALATVWEVCGGLVGGASADVCRFFVVDESKGVAVE